MCKAENSFGVASLFIDRNLESKRSAEKQIEDAGVETIGTPIFQCQSFDCCFPTHEATGPALPTPFPSSISDELQAFPRYLPGTLCLSLIAAPENVGKN